MSLESCPDAVNQLLKKLGAKNLKAVDIVTLTPADEEEKYENVVGILLTIPRDMIKPTEEDQAEDIFYVERETAGLGGIVSLINILGNGLDKIQFDEGSALKDWIDSAKDMSPVDRAKSLAENEALQNAIKLVLGDSVTPHDDVTHRMVSFVQLNGKAYEMNGVSEKAINIGDSQEDELVEKVAHRCMNYFEGEKETKFNLIALILEK